ncbi:uncharacterized protein LOC117789802 [Drosophila innubila]|uniref:uncharacterized protein LOC117789802 n=1 Tax=Drosophila innubila TaxID=198719 RepID=UPI00148D8919|nr:uncharacterized protein LOC117789802 [Drosophila innubila]XP_034484829.1 uncharacterized protein LOC117789802 [Drosophila innubila]
MPPNSESFNLDELEAPSWMDAQYFRDVLRGHENDEGVEVIALKISPASGKGDHYASIMFRAAVEYKSEKGKFIKSLIIKTMPEKEGHKKELLEESHVFETEINMYAEMLPKFEEILRQTGDETSLYVPCIYYSMKPRQVMIFEDLVPQGYIVNRSGKPTIEEVHCAYTKLAKWHAVSLKLNKEQPLLMEKFKHSLMELPGIDKDPMFSTGMDYFLKLLDSMPDLKEYKPYFEKIRPNYLKHCINTFKEYRENPQEDAYYVLCHGDFHIRNMMFKHNKTSGALEDCMLLDFQMSYLGPMPNDIIYSIYNLLSSEQRQNQRDEIIYFYFSTLTDTLKKINYDGEMPSLVKFREQLFRHKYLEFFLLTTFMPLLLALRNGKYELSEMIENKHLRSTLYNEENYISEVRYNLKRYLHLGYFEDLQ